MLTGHTLASNGFLLATTFALIECLAFQKFSPNGAIVFYPALTGLGIIGMVAIFPGRYPGLWLGRTVGATEYQSPIMASWVSSPTGCG